MQTFPKKTSRLTRLFSHFRIAPREIPWRVDKKAYDFLRLSIFAGCHVLRAHVCSVVNSLAFLSVGFIFFAEARAVFFLLFFAPCAVCLSRESNSVWQKFLQQGSLRQPWRPFYCLPGRRTDRKKNLLQLRKFRSFLCFSVGATFPSSAFWWMAPSPWPQGQFVAPAPVHTSNQVRPGASVQKHYRYRPRGCIGQLEIYLFLN